MLDIVDDYLSRTHHPTPWLPRKWRRRREYVRCLLRSARMENEIYGQVVSPSLEIGALEQIRDYWPVYESHPDSLIVKMWM